VAANHIAQVFQRIWSGRVINERTAWELLSLVDQIHLWAITEFRAFILEHLRPWHKFSEENYLLDWDSVYDTSRQRKRKRTCSDGEDLLLPSWTNHLSETVRQRVQLRAKKSLTKALEEHRLRKGKSKIQDDPRIVCMIGECSRSQEARFGSDEAWLDHIRCHHDYPERELVQIKLCLDQGALAAAEEDDQQQEQEEERLSGSVTASLIDDDPAPSKRVRVF
jgi:hypothetical protein